jgi:glyoxylate/hydroxypyruvate reductase
MKRILIASGGGTGDIASLFRAELPDHEILTEAPGTGEAPVANAVVGRPAPGVLSSLPKLELVLSLWAGVEHLLAGGEIPADVPIVRLADEGLAGGMADWVLAQALAWHRNLFLYRELQAKREWAPLPEKLARERTVLVLGAGALGMPVAEHFVRFGFRTRVWSRSGRAVAGADSFRGRDELLAAAAGADILVNLLPLTAATADIVDAPLLAALAPGAFFVNGARGGHVVERHLVAALDSGHLSGAALDVFRMEPLPAEDPLWRHPKVLVSPHVAAPTHDAVAVKEIARTVQRFERGEPLRHAVDRTLGY